MHLFVDLSSIVNSYKKDRHENSLRYRNSAKLMLQTKSIFIFNICTDWVLPPNTNSIYGFMVCHILWMRMERRPYDAKTNYSIYVFIVHSIECDKGNIRFCFFLHFFFWKENRNVLSFSLPFAQSIPLKFGKRYVTFDNNHKKCCRIQKEYIHR